MIKLKLRKLEQSEHNSTRPLWESVFDEDTKAFLDYYYFIKTRENEIYVIEEDDDIRSMIHLNPYQIQIGDKQFIGHYIIAVATEPEYRKRGYMGALLRRTMQDMYNRGEMFTYLMPAAESIYLPYDFRFVYDQEQCELPEHVLFADETKAEDNRAIELLDASMWNAGEMAAFFQEHFAAKWQVCAVRDEAYYQSLLFERQSEHGGIKLIKEDGRLAGMFTYMQEDGLEILEPLILDGYEDVFENAVLKMNPEQEDSVKVYAYQKVECTESERQKKPMIMARILRLEKLLAAMKVKEGETVNCSFAVLDAVLPQNSRIWSVCGSEKLQVRETEDSEGVLTIGALTSLLFGYKTVEEVMQEEDVFLTEHLAKELEKIEVLGEVFINELV